MSKKASLKGTRAEKHWTLNPPAIHDFRFFQSSIKPGAHLGEEGGDTFPAHKKKSAFEQTFCPENDS